MNDQQKQAELLSILKDVAALLKEKGMADKEIDQTIMKLVTEIEMAVIEEIIATLPADKRKQLDEMSEQNKSTDEIASKLQLDPAQANKIELRKFKEIIGEFIASLDTQK
jgi:hypothetical protein